MNISLPNIEINWFVPLNQSSFGSWPGGRHFNIEYIFPSLFITAVAFTQSCNH